MKITKAIVAAAGSGTRFLPVTKTIQKEMLPIMQKPVIDFVIDDCIKAGITEFIFVVNSQNEQIKQYYSEDLYWQRYLVRMQKLEKYDLIKNLHTKAKFSFVIQKEMDDYGTSIPLRLAKDYVKDDEAFMLVMGDDFYYHQDSGSEASEMIQEFETANGDALLTCVNVPQELQHKYGIADYKIENGIKILTKIIEKPEAGATQSTLANTSKYIFTNKIYQFLDIQTVDPKLGEFLLTTPLSQMVAAGMKVVVHEGKGSYQDCGFVLGWLKANLTVAKNDPELWGEIVKFVNS